MVEASGGRYPGCITSCLNWQSAYITSCETGELIVAALDRGVKHIILGIGGSATNNGGAGMMQVLGVVLRDKLGMFDFSEWQGVRWR